ASPFIRSHALSKGRAREGASCWRSRRSSLSEPRSLRQAEQVAVRASETAVRGAQEQRRSARNGDRRGTEKVGMQLQEVWRRHHGADAIESAGGQSFRSGAVLCRVFRSGHDARNSAASIL